MSTFDEIYEQYFEDVFKFLRSLTLNESLAEELTQETFFKALKAVDKFKGECDMRVWLCQIAKNSYFSYLKTQKRISNDENLNNLAAESNLEDLIADKELAFKLHEILHKLNEPYKEVFSLRVFGELSFKQIGLLFGKTEHWACVTYHRAKIKIQNEMREQDENRL